MKAAIFQRIGQPLIISDIPNPTISPDELLLKVKYCGICGSDLHCTQESLMTVNPGTILGHEFSGEIVEIGNNANDQWKIGDLITALPANGCGQCTFCHQKSCFLCSDLRIIGLSDIPGAYADYIKIKTSSAIKLPTTFDARMGALIEPYAVALHAVNLSKLTEDDNVLVLGAGPIGLAVIELIKSKVNKIIVSDKISIRRALALKLGASEALDPTDLAEKFKDLVGSSPNIIFECVGNPGLLQNCIDVAGQNSQLIILGACMKAENISSLSATMKELTIKFSLGSNQKDFEDVITLFQAKSIQGLPIVSDIINLSQLPSMFESLRAPIQQIKVLIKPDE